MGRFFRRGKSKIWFVPTIADPTYPATAAELADGMDLSWQIHAITGFQISNNPIPVPDLVSNFTRSIGGEDVVGESSLTFYDSATSGGFAPGVTTPWQIRTALAKGSLGYIVLFPYGLNHRSDRWYVQTTGVNDEWTTGNEAARFVVGFATLERPYTDTNILIPLPAPTGLHAGAVSPTLIELIWNASSAADLAGYHVYRDGNPTPYEGSLSVVTPHFFDSNVALGETHTYQVTAYDSTGNESPRSNLISVSATTDQTPPSQPQNLQVQLL